MAIWDRFRNKERHKFGGQVTRLFEEYGSDESEHLRIVKALKYFESDPVLRTTVLTHTAYSIGNGYFLSVDDKEDGIALNNKKRIEKFLDMHRFEEFLSSAAIDLWLTGNTFWHGMGTSNNDIKGFTQIPTESIQDIMRKPDGTIKGYRQVLDMSNEIKPNQMMHWTWRRFHGSAWGVGLGQPYVSVGVGYLTKSGNTVQAPSLAASCELLRHLSSTGIYEGAPRYLVSLGEKASDDDITTATNLMDNLEPNQTLLTNHDTKVDVMGFGPKTNFGSYIDFLEKQITLHMQSPIPRMFPNPENFSYASADKAAELMFPEIDGFQRNLKQLVEQTIFRPLCDKAKHKFDDHPVRINWGKEDTTGTDNIKLAIYARRAGAPIAWRSIIDMFNEEGIDVKLDKNDSMSKEQAIQWAEKELERRTLHKLGKEIDGED